MGRSHTTRCWRPAHHEVITPRRGPAHRRLAPPTHACGFPVPRRRSQVWSPQAHASVSPAASGACGPRAARDVGRGRGAEGLLRPAAGPSGRPWGRFFSRPRAGPAHLCCFPREQELTQEICLENQVCTGQGPLRARSPGARLDGGGFLRGQTSTRGHLGWDRGDRCLWGAGKCYIRVRR